MENCREMLSFLDMLDLDEDLVDSRLKTLMVRSSHTNEHLCNALQLLQYKFLINLHENSDCGNAEELDFVVKLIKEIQPETADNVCRITNIVLNLNSCTLVSNSEFLLQQILSNLDVANNVKSSDDSSMYVPSQPLLFLRICDSVLDAVMKKGEKVCLLVFELPMEDILNCADEKLKIHFITSTIPKLFEGVIGYNVLDKLWDYILKMREENTDISLKILSCLSHYYLPVVNRKGCIKYESEIIKQMEFWNIILNGLMSPDFSLRKMSVYLAKMAIDLVSNTELDLNIRNDEQILFRWDYKRAASLKNEWDNFFILLDSLEEKQSNIVLPSLQLFETIYNIENCWLNCAFNLGLKHDNSQVRFKCIEHRLKIKINNITEASILLEALDDYNFYDNKSDTDNLKKKIASIIIDEEIFNIIIQSLTVSRMFPVPFFHMTDVLANLEVKFKVSDKLSDTLLQLLKVPCNIIAIRKGVQVNILTFIGKNFKNLDWMISAQIVSNLHIDIKTLEAVENPFIDLIKEIAVKDEDKNELFNYVTKSHVNIDFGLLYLKHHREDVNYLANNISLKLNKVKDIVNRQYSSKIECFNDVVFLLQLYNKCDIVTELLEVAITKEMTVIILYAYNLITSEVILSVDEVKLLFDSLNLSNKDNNELLIEIYKSSLLLLKDVNTDINKAVLSMFFVNNLSNNSKLKQQFKHEMLDLKGLLDILNIFERKKVNNVKNLGRSRNIFYEKHSETMYYLLEENEMGIKTENLVDYIEKVIESGGYGCLRWVLKIMNLIIPSILEVKFDVHQFINRMWREIEELKTNYQYPLCMREFVEFITQDVLLERPEFNNTITSYYIKLIEYGQVKNSPLFYLIEELAKKDVKKYAHVVFILSEFLLYCPVPRKDLRITDNLAVHILKNPNYGLKNDEIDLHFNYEIQYSTIAILSQIKDDYTLDIISSLLTAKIENIFKAKLRYHGNSQIHRTVQTAIQNLLFILLLKSDYEVLNLMNWAMELLGKLPHQGSVRICLEWCISLCLYLQNQPLNKKLILKLRCKKVSLQSQFTIIYWLLKHKIARSTFTDEEYEFVLDTLLSHTMGQMFNVRLQAQYLATKLYRANKKYEYTMQIINKTLADNSTDKNLMKLKDDYFVNDFDLIENLSSCFIFYNLPRLCDVGSNENINKDYVVEIFTKIEGNIRNLTFKRDNCRSIEFFLNLDVDRNVDAKVLDGGEITGTIQKKYIPWKSMGDVGFNVEEKRESLSELIVVASLIDKLPNLGGMARTSEVFGVNTYVIDSLRHLQDRQFQGLSVSAERWINIEEIRPGPALKQYLCTKKAEGYSVVAAEQTSTSTKLQKFQFPKKTLLLLGHEKDGVPSDLLPIMDHCVEIPQQGYVRSLNVHVTAAIFVWEYARQHLL